MARSSLQDVTVLLRADDPVVVAARALPAGTELTAGEHVLRCSGDVPAGHKVAVTAIPAGHEIRKYGQPIGVATCDIAPGDHVHTHNMAIAQFHHDYAFGTEARHDEPVPLSERATFQGFVRADGRAATRNYLGILTSVNCSATAARLVASQFGPGSAALASYPNVDGVVALTHGTGCGMDATGDGLRLLRRTLGGYARHPNFAGLLVLGLGCEVNQVEALTADFDLPADTPVAAMTIQELGGTRATVREAAARIRELAAEADKARRTTVAVSELILGLECGGSDGFSGITANPALGAAADLLVQQGGTAVLGETPEIYGAEQLLTRRAVTREVGEKLVELIHWWERYVASSGSSLDSNPSPGNKAGGLTTILEKSLGAAAKGGTSDLAEVYHYAEQVTAAGLVFMDTPGYDPVSVTGMVAGGANVVCFTTGRGSVFGAKPAPSIKLVSNSATYRRMTEDMDINCGVIADGEATVAEVGKQVFDLVLEVASGRRTASEELGFGDEEFVPWQLGAVV